MATEEERILKIIVDSDKAIKKIIEYREALEALRKKEAELKKQKESSEIEEQQYRSEMEQTRILTKQYTESIRVLTKEVNNNIKSDREKSTSLKGLRAQLSNLTAAYDNLQREERESARGRELLDKINNVTKELKEAEYATQRYYRNVGNYASAFDGLGMSVQQVARELPSLSMGFNTFFLAISNNLPILIDQIALARKEYDALIKAGKNATPVWKQLISSIFSWQTALVVGVTVLSMYGKEIINWVSSLVTGKNALSDMESAMKDFGKNVGDSSGEMIASVNKLSSEWKSLGGSLEEQKKFIKQNKSEFDKLGISIDNVSDAENAFVRNKDSFVDSIIARSKSAAMMDIAAEKYKEAVTKMIEADKLPDKIKTMVNIGNQYQSNWVSGEYDNQEKAKLLKEKEELETVAEELVRKAAELTKEGESILSNAGIKQAEKATKSAMSMIKVTDKELEAIRQMEDALVEIIKANKEIERNKVAEAYDKEIEALKAKLNAEKALTEGSQKEILSLIEETEKKKRELMEGFSFDTEVYEEQRRTLAKSYDDEIVLLKNKLSTERGLTEGSQKEILSLIEETEKKKRELMEGFSFDTEVYEEQRRTLAKSYDDEIVLLKNKLSTERGLTEEAQNQILKIIKAKEKEKSEAVAKVSIVDADLEEERQRTILVYDREIEDLKKRLETEKDLTEKAREAILEIIKAKEIQKENELDKLNDESLNREIERQQKQIQLQLDGVKEGTEEEHNLRVKALELQRESELSNKELTEQMKLAIVKKYEKLMNEEAIRYAEDTAQAQSDAIKLQFETAIAEAYGNEQEILRIQMEQKKAELDAIQQMEGESLEEFNLRRLTAENEYLSAKQDLADKEVEIEQSKLQAMSDVTGGLISLIEAIGEENKAMAVASKILALAQIAIDTGRAISSGVAEAIKAGPFPANLAAIATTVAAVMANIATAIKTVKSAKFATGGDVTGAGTGTSDSIPAMLSNGESVMTAKATSMFAPILSAFNQAGGGVPIYGQQAGSRAMGEDMLAKSFAKGLEKMPAPVVSVEEISTVTNRVKVIENINRI